MNCGPTTERRDGNKEREEGSERGEGRGEKEKIGETRMRITRLS
jgi:hypothetical protein